MLNSDPSENDQSDEDFEEGLVKVDVVSRIKNKYVSPQRMYYDEKRKTGS